MKKFLIFILILFPCLVKANSLSAVAQDYYIIPDSMSFLEPGRPSDPYITTKDEWDWNVGDNTTVSVNLRLKYTDSIQNATLGSTINDGLGVAFKVPYIFFNGQSVKITLLTCSTNSASTFDYASYVYYGNTATKYVNLITSSNQHVVSKKNQHMNFSRISTFGYDYNYCVKSTFSFTYEGYNTENQYMAFILNGPSDARVGIVGFFGYQIEIDGYNYVNDEFYFDEKMSQFLESIAHSNSQVYTGIENLNELSEKMYGEWQLPSSCTSGDVWCEFFSNRNDNDHGLSGIIAAPLRLVNGLTTSCTPITFTIFEKDITLPCGDTLFWNRSDVSTFRMFWNILFGGFIIYRLGLKVYHIILKSLDPNDDKVEVEKL